MEKHFFTEKDQLYFAELKAEKMSKLELKLFSLFIFSIMLISSPIGMFFISLFLFLLPAFIHFLIFDLNIWLIMLVGHFVYYECFFKAKYERELLPDFYVMQESNQILKNRLKHHNYN